MPRNDDYEDAEDYLDSTYEPEDQDGYEFNELSAKEQESVLEDMFFKGTLTPKQSAHDMRIGLDRPHGTGRGEGKVNLRGHIHHVERDNLGRFKKWLD